MGRGCGSRGRGLLGGREEGEDETTGTESSSIIAAEMKRRDGQWEWGSGDGRRGEEVMRKA